ncbi:CopD family protein [Breoghania sp.]|uniref:copper resistance CopC/CopD family protein n=1 Tax=Breoghania sp. TaxID=2065378 RepID=UPI0029CA5A81|nr:CopD family protein [Breoghania sp.]
MVNIFRDLFALLSAALLLVVFGSVSPVAQQAHAHAALTSTEPADAAILKTAPKRFLLQFNEPVAPLVLRLVAPNGAATELERSTLRDTTLDIEAPANLAEGTHVLSWRVVSQDGHPIGGSLIFSIGTPSAGTDRSQTAPDWSVRIGYLLARAMLYVGLFLGIGGLAATSFLFAAGMRPARLYARLLVLGATGGVVSLGFQGLDALGAPLAQIVSLAPWRAALSTSLAPAVGVGLAAFSLAALARSPAGTEFAKGALARPLIAVAAVVACLSLALSGHAATASPQALMRPAVFIHAAAVLTWIGALLPLGLALRRRDPQALPALDRFSRVIPVALLLLLASGLFIAWVQVQQPTALWDTAYGRVLLVKLSLVALLLVFAAQNRWRLTQPVLRAEQAPTRRLVRMIAIETVLAVCVLCVVTTWRYTPPPRSLLQLKAPPVSLHIHSEAAMATLSLDPGQVGETSASIELLTGDFAPLTAKEVDLVMACPHAGIEPFRRKAQRQDEAIWTIPELAIPVACNWTVRIEILISDFELRKLKGRIEIDR